MSAATRREFEEALTDLDVSVSHTDGAGFRAHVDDIVEAPAVGVSFDAAFDDPELSLDATAVDVDPTPAALREATTGVTAASFGIADYGSIVLAPDGRGSELVSLFADVHVAVLRESDVVREMDDAIASLDETVGETGESAIIATGASATADMGALVNGVHGPRAVHVVVVEEGA